jgi:hypothetical protein
MGISPLFSHEVGWPQVGFFRHEEFTRTSITVFDAPGMEADGNFNRNFWSLKPDFF